jgi:5-methylcytosine-specific restriction endonuclease McrA
LQFQQLLFGDDSEALAQEVARIAALEKQRNYAVARKTAWDQAKPFPEDRLKWCAAHREYMNAFWRMAYRLRHDSVAEYYLRSAARSRANRLGCKIGKSRAILKVYRKAVHAPVLLCYWCKKVTFAGERHVDHKEPLASGGAHVAGNLCITCAECNLSKNDRCPHEFREATAEKRAANSMIARDYFRAEYFYVLPHAGWD